MSKSDKDIRGSATQPHSGPSVDRRKFLGGIAAGAGGPLLLSACGGSRSGSGGPQGDKYAPSGSSWTGYGGEGDYATANGNTEAVVNNAHGAIRDRTWPDLPKGTAEETVDLIIVGGGFSGITAAYEFSKNAKGGQTALLLENHPVPGGEAKYNEFDVDGQTLYAPQGSNDALLPLPGYEGGRYQTFFEYWKELGLPEHYDYVPLAGGAEKLKLAENEYMPMLLPKAYELGFFFGKDGWRINPARNDFKDTPWTPEQQQELADFLNNSRDLVSEQSDPDRWLDTMTYAELLEKLGYSKFIQDYINPLLSVGNFGVAASGVSALGVSGLRCPGPFRAPRHHDLMTSPPFPFPAATRGSCEASSSACCPRRLPVAPISSPSARVRLTLPPWTAPATRSGYDLARRRSTSAMMAIPLLPNPCSSPICATANCIRSAARR